MGGRDNSLAGEGESEGRSAYVGLSLQFFAAFPSDYSLFCARPGEETSQNSGFKHSFTSTAFKN
jgi:hypothetical protein